MNSKPLLTVCALLFLIPNTYPLDLEGAKEKTCFPIKKTVEIDSQWMMSVKEWYYPLMSPLDLYLHSLELYGNTEDPTKLQESQVYYDTCLKAKLGENFTIATGFNGKTTSFSFDWPTVNDDGVTYQRFISESGLDLSSYITLTDNMSYLFMVICWDDNKASWGVMSNVDRLPEETAKLIDDHAEALGFKREYFEELRYGNCHEGRTNTISVQGSETCTITGAMFS